MNLLKEYIRLLVEEAMDEDVNLKRLNPGMLGIYSLAQAINKLIYEGDALPGALPIDIISSGKDLKSAPMVTDTERKSGISIQHSGSTFKLYIDPSKQGTMMSGANETHDIVHTITGYIAKAIARRRESIEDSGKYSGTPSKFNKITLKKDIVQDFINKFEKIFGYRLPYSLFEKTFEFKSPSEYGEWFGNTVYPKIKKTKLKNAGMSIEKKKFRDIGYSIYRAVFGLGQTIPGMFAKQYWGDTDVSGIYIDPTDTWSSFGVTRVPLDKYSPVKLTWKQSMEDEEMIGNIINMAINEEVASGQPVNVNNVEKIFQVYKQAPSPSISKGNYNLEDYKLRFDTPETRKALKRLFELYNEFLRRYTVGLSTAQPTRKQAAKAAEKQYDREQVTPAQLKAARQSLRAKREPSPFPEPAPVRRPRRAASPARPTKKAPAKRTKR